jgi:phage repressor protein C with HTH and peptisase S24 domain
MVQDNVSDGRQDFAQRLRRALLGAGYPERGGATRLARDLGISERAVGKWLNGESMPDTKRLDALSRTLGVPAEWLLTGRPAASPLAGFGLNGSVGVAEPANTYHAKCQLRLIPVVGIVQGGQDAFWEAMDFPVGYGDGSVDWPSEDDSAYAVECRGDSMAPRIRHGEYVVVEPHTPYSPGDDVVVIGKDGRKMIKVFVYKRAGRVYLDSVNADHPQFSLDDAEVDEIHYVAGIVKRSRHVERG